MDKLLNFKLTLPTYLFNHGNTIGSSTHINGSRHLNNFWTTTTLNAISHPFTYSSDLRENVAEGFAPPLCKKIRQLWREFCLAISNCFSKIYRRIKSPFTPSYPKINQDLSMDTLKKIYWGLGKENKWMECIDARYHNLGKYVFDRGLHAGTVEPGFIVSMEKAFDFVQNFVNLKIDANWYLLLHKHTCGHFNGDRSIYLMGQEKVGVFRTSDDNVCCNYSGLYAITPEARAEYEALDRALKSEFGNSYGLGELTYTDTTCLTTHMSYKAMSRDQVGQIFNKFLKEFYQEVGCATTPDQKLWAIARLHQRMEWLHPVKDGTSRTSIAMMNKFLTDYGFHPAILEYPHVSTCYGLVRWKQYLQEGLLKWEAKRSRFGPS
ncbi:MAG: hypothetical protein WA347_06150 [Rhabdochlamydiaceae bacterium]